MYDNNFRLEGTIKERFDTVNISDNFRKREFVLSVSRPSDNNTDLIKFQCINNNVDLIDNVRIGNRVIVKFMITGKKWEKDEDVDVYFTNLNCQEIDVLDDTNLEEHTPSPGVIYRKDINVNDLIPGVNKSNSDDDDKYDDLPF